MSTRDDADFDAWKAQVDATSERMVDTCDRMLAGFDRIDALLQSILDHLDGKAADVPPTNVASA